MYVTRVLLVCHSLFWLLLLPAVVLGAAAETMQTYIVQLHPHDEGDSGVAMLSAPSQGRGTSPSREVRGVGAGEAPSSRLLYSYHTVFGGHGAASADGGACARRAPGVASVRHADRRGGAPHHLLHRFGAQTAPIGAWARSGTPRHHGITGRADKGEAQKRSGAAQPWCSPTPR
ncbi:unnamed protein product [Miscanthus lutarioriparius]|uniref:Uncharacterized protein n=1 Tax=Miscanthus lutarioriparius TaxID=422564 RepID=A0A811R4I9_9POAL|nr:unnamed protein product [Miscanthus lutarioriparius]